MCMFLWMWEAVWVCYSKGGEEVVLTMGSLSRNNIGASGARDLGAALQVNTTLTKLR